MNTMPARSLAFALCLITCAVNLPAPLYPAYAQLSGVGNGATALAFASYVIGVIPVLLLLGGLADRLGRKRLIATALILVAGATTLLMVAPGMTSLATARCLLGLGTGLASATGLAYMQELMPQAPGQAAAWVASSTSVGFGLGAALTSLCLFARPSLAPPSYWLELGLVGVALALLWRLPGRAPGRDAPMLKLPGYPVGTVLPGLAILLAWATVGVVIALLPSVLNLHGLALWSGFSTFTVISCGLLFQPLARRMLPTHSVALGLAILPPSYGLIAWGALQGQLAWVLVGTVLASSACYGFIYLGGLATVAERAGAEKTRASAGFFLLAYLGFSVPVVLTGALADRFGSSVALGSFGLSLAACAVLLLACLLRQKQRLSVETRQARQERAT
ncbi:MFS transporter [Pseudomonas massiliensis]|uniref:MFS transporter n=1 Tax=Pseudomonas massiliensis TaxID=522492 RepID=UPI000A06BD6D|nr:MFS transporter [Pseudomonas massiliensis]